MLTDELMSKQLQRYRDLTALGYRFKARHDYWNAKLAFESSILTIYPLYRANGDRDHRPYDMANVKLNQHNLSKIHLNYSLKTIFNDSRYWYNYLTDWQLLDSCLKYEPTMTRALISYQAIKWQNVMPNYDIWLRQKYGCFGLMALNDYYLERRHALIHREADDWISNADKLLKLNKCKAKSRQFNKN